MTNTTETPMRERIARLLARLGDDREENWPNWTNCADAVLDAMREPTDALCEAGLSAFRERRLQEVTGHVDAFDEREFEREAVFWRAMIDAAKEGK